MSSRRSSKQKEDVREGLFYVLGNLMTISNYSYCWKISLQKIWHNDDAVLFYLLVCPIVCLLGHFLASVHIEKNFWTDKI